ncbi:hypothetical protein JKP88DRAFT_243858 [Tribonema minus]|uniref:Uncharacterized protein n=1 Tax=Tribonema minus TaxID=303371 RepID=A0A836CJ36_9STRA|nr:hypothetical protein JKP88DRAFT_243858 [Tribonema minus]
MPAFVHIIMCIFLVVSAVYTSFVTNNGCTVVTPDSGGHLYWAWNNAAHSRVYYMFFLCCLGMMAAYGLEYALFFTSMNFISYAFSYYVYGPTKTVGAQWCFLAAFAPWITLAFVDVEKRGHRDMLRRLTTSTPVTEVKRLTSKIFMLDE